VDTIVENLEDLLVDKKLVVMHCDSHIRDMFKQCYRTENMGVQKIWAKAFIVEHYKSLATNAIKELLSVHSSYLCDQGFPR